MQDTSVALSHVSWVNDYQVQIRKVPAVAKWM